MFPRRYILGTGLQQSGRHNFFGGAFWRANQDATGYSSYKSPQPPLLERTNMNSLISAGNGFPWLSACFDPQFSRSFRSSWFRLPALFFLVNSPFYRVIWTTREKPDPIFVLPTK
jgi:hypothetical protein